MGTSEFYGEIWKAMLRTPRARLPAIRYLDKRIPKNEKFARDLHSRGGISLSDYTIKIIEHQVVIDPDPIKKEQNRKRAEIMSALDYFYFYYPNKTQLVINALISGL